MTTGAVEVQPTRRAPLADDGSEVSLRIICPDLLVPAARDRHAGNLRPRHQSPSGASWTPGDRGDSGQLLDAGRGELRRRGRRAVSDGAARRPDLRPGGPDPRQSHGQGRPCGRHGPLPGGPVPGHDGRGQGARGRCHPRPLGNPHRTRRGVRRLSVSVSRASSRCTGATCT